MLKNIIILLISMTASIGYLEAQSARTYKKKTFVLRKKSVVTTSTEITPSVEKQEVIPTVVRPVTTTKKQVARLPTIAGGTFGLLDIQAYREDMTFSNWDYVVLQYDVSAYGRSINIEVEKYSSRRFADYIIRKLKQTRWNPALDFSKKPIDYTLYKQVVIVKQQLNEEDYRKQY